MPPRRNGVMGPASALTSFLRDQGITARHGTGYRSNAPPAAIAEDDAPAANAEAGPGPSTSAAAGLSPSTRSANLDPDQLSALAEDDEDEDVVVRKKRKVAQVLDSSDIDQSDADSSLTPAQEKKKKLELVGKKRAAERKAKAQQAYADDSDDSDDLDGSAATARRKKAALAAIAKGSAGPPQIGSRLTCGECDKQFTYSKYSPPAANKPGRFLCHACAKAFGLSDYKGPQAAPKKKVERRQIVHYEAKARVPALTDVCISIVARHLEDVESLGDIGHENMRRVNNIICKNRKMTKHTATLFYDASVIDLTMKDCTLLDAEAFEILAGLCPSLRTLHLSLCGQMQSSSLLALAKLQHLRRLELYAPFLVRKEAWAQFFELMGKREGGGLDGILIRNSPRMDERALEALVEYNPNLKELRLSLIEQFAESWLDKIAWLRKLTLLDISYPAKSLDGATAVGGAPQPGGADAEGGLMSTAIDAATPAEGSAAQISQEERQAKVDHSAHSIVCLLAALGPNLTHLSLAGHSFLTADILAEAIGKHCPKLTHLDLSDLPLLTDDETAAFIAAWAPVGLVDVRFKACHALGSATLKALLALPGELETLIIAGWKDCDQDVLQTIGSKKGSSLRELDVSWCRNATDFTLKEIVEQAPVLEDLAVWGCISVTRNHPRRKNLKIVGVESHEFGSAALA